MPCCLIFGVARIDNTPTAPQKGLLLPAARDTIRDSQSLTLTALGDGHAMPSIFAVTPAASVNVGKLMDTLFRASSAPINVTARCNIVALRARRSNVTSPSGRYHQGLFSTRVPRTESNNSGSINKNIKTSRHTFRWSWITEKGGLTVALLARQMKAADDNSDGGGYSGARRAAWARR
jgi:hypothetical protein